MPRTKKELQEAGRTVAKKVQEKTDKDLVKGREIANRMLVEASKDLMPRIEKKVNEVAEKVEELAGKDLGLITTQIEAIIGKRSLEEIATARLSKPFTPEEILIGLEYYRQLIATINEKVSYPPSVFSYCSFMGMTFQTYKAYRTDPDKAEAINMVDDYVSGVQFTSAQLGKIKEITTIFGLKSLHGFYEAQAPVQVKGEVKVDIDDIRNQIKEINKGRVIEVEPDKD